MDLATELLVIGVVVPAVIAAVFAWGALRFRSARVVQIYALPTATAAAFVMSYVLLPDDWAAIRPQRHWQWLPYLAIAAAAVGPAGLFAGRSAWVRWLVLCALAVGAAYLLVPMWPDLQPARPASIAVVALYLGVLMLALDRLAPRLPGTWLLGLLTIVAVVLAAALAIDVMRFGQLAGIAAASLAGCWVAAAIAPLSIQHDLRGLTPFFVVLVGGASYVGCVEPERPMWWLLLIPTIPLVIGPILSRLKPYRASASSAQ